MSFKQSDQHSADIITDVFGETVLYNGNTYIAIVDHESVTVPGGAFSQVSTLYRTLTLNKADIDGIPRGATVTVGSVDFTVGDLIEDDGVLFTVQIT